MLMILNLFAPRLHLNSTKTSEKEKKKKALNEKVIEPDDYRIFYELF
jgi:hypothetical protein